jgi:hypothetical protein
MIDYTDYIDLYEGQERKIIMTCTIRLDKETILDALRYDTMFIDGYTYKTPKKTLINCLELEKYGSIRISFEQI